MAVAQLPANTPTHAIVRLSNDPKMLVFELSRAEEAPALRSLAGHMIWHHTKDEDKENLALRFGLITDQTSAILVKMRADGEKAETLPQITKIPHMIPAGMVRFDMEIALSVSSLDFCHSNELPPSGLESGTWQIPEENILNLLIGALEELLNIEPGEITLEKLLEHLPRYWRRMVRAYLETQYPNRFDRQAAMQLWQEINSGKLDETMILNARVKI